jgi:hypothetical protein
MALITAEEARDYIPGLTGTGEDTTLGKYILRADSLMASWCGYPPSTAGADPTLEDVTYTHYFDGPSEVHARALYLEVSPVQSITTAKTDTIGDWAYDTTIDSGDRTLDGVEGVLYINPDAPDGWLKGLRAIEVVYVAGYSTTPEWLKNACGVYVAHMWRLRKERGKTSVSAGGSNINTIPDVLPPEVKQLLAGHRLIGGFLG